MLSESLQMHPVASEPSTQPGMGANLVPGGCVFRVWAPHAEAVSVIGEFNDWNAEANPLALEGSGYWSGEVVGAKYRDEYKYAIFHHGQILRRNDPYAREMTNSNGASVIIDPSFDWGDTSDYRTPPWHEWVIYEMHIGTFHGHCSERPGNFDRAVQRLDHLVELGVNAIEVMPSAEFPGSHSWGYNPAHQFAIERDYGGPKAFRRFIKAAHQRGMAVILDVVYNHFGPTDIDLWQFDGWHAPGHDGGIYIYDNNRARTPWGHTRPDYGRGEVRQFLRDNALFWLEEFQLDGLRFDATAYIRSVDGFGGNVPDGWSLMQWINGELNARQPWKVMIAEDLRNNAWITRPTNTGGAGFDTQWAAAFVHPIRQAIVAHHDHDRNMDAVRDAITHRYNGDPLQRVIYTESHDEVANGSARVAEEIWPGNADSWFSKKRSTLGAAVVMTSPGIPMIFQGQEFLEDRWFADTDPLDWSRRDRYVGIVQLYRDLIRLRRNWFDNSRGLRGAHVHVHHVNNMDKVLAMHRWNHSGPGDDVVVVFNFANRSLQDYRIGFPRPGYWHLRMNTDASVYDEEFGATPVFDASTDDISYDGFASSARVTLPPYTALIFSQ